VYIYVYIWTHRVNLIPSTGAQHAGQRVWRRRRRRGGGAGGAKRSGGGAERLGFGDRCGGGGGGGGGASIGRVYIYLYM